MGVKWLSRISFVLSGLFLVVALFARSLFSEWDEPGLFFLIAGSVFLTVGLVLDRKNFWHLLTARAARRGRSVGLILLLLFAGLFAVNYGVSYLPGKIDFTTAKAHTLSSRSRDVVKSFQGQVEFLYFQMPDENSRGADETIRLALQKYIDENANFKLTKINIMDHPELAKKYNLNAQEQAMFVTHKDRAERFYKTDENTVTQALLRLLKGRKTLYFSVGHGELTFENTNPRGISDLKKELERLFYELQEINLDKEVLPENAAGLVILAPEKNLSESFKQKVWTYFENGGRIFIAFDPVQNPDENGLLAQYGLKMSAGVVHQEQNAIANVGSFVVSGWSPQEGAHAITKSMEKESPVMFYVTGSLSEIMPHNFKTSPVIVSPTDTVLRKGFTKQDAEIDRGSYRLVMAVENDKKGILVASADSDIFANQFLYQQQNPLFMFHVFGHLTRDEDVVKPMDTTNITKDFLVTDTNFKLYVGLFAIPLPLCFLFMANFWWFRRRWL